jgi:hypothetical protein
VSRQSTTVPVLLKTAERVLQFVMARIGWVCAIRPTSINAPVISRHSQLPTGILSFRNAGRVKAPQWQHLGLEQVVSRMADSYRSSPYLNHPRPPLNMIFCHSTSLSRSCEHSVIFCSMRVLPVWIYKITQQSGSARVKVL